MAASEHAHAQPTTGPGRQALIDAAIAVVARRGLRGLTYRAVAEEAGVTHALVTHHFGSRDAFIREVVESSTRQAESGIFTDDESLEQFAARLPEFASEHDELLTFQYELMLEARRRPELRETIDRMWSESEHVVATQFDRLGVADESGDLARFVFAVLDGLLLQQVVYGKPERTAATLDILRQLLVARADWR
jgi:AcrR family transcriptional regulator